MADEKKSGSSKSSKKEIIAKKTLNIGSDSKGKARLSATKGEDLSGKSKEELDTFRKYKVID